MKEYKKLTEAESTERFKKYDEIKAKIKKEEKKDALLSFILIIPLLSMLFFNFPKYDSPINIMLPFCIVIIILGFLIVKIRFKVIDLKKQKEYFDDIFKEERKEERATFEGVITLTNGQEVSGTFIQKADSFFEKKTETLYYKDKILAVKIIE